MGRHVVSLHECVVGRSRQWERGSQTATHIESLSIAKAHVKVSEGRLSSYQVV